MDFPRRSTRWTCTLAAALLLCAPLALASDQKGQFAVKGAGAFDCATFTAEMAKGDHNAFMFGGWVYGYITASNQHSPGTFDLAPWESLETLIGYLAGYCKANPRVSLAQAVFTLLHALQPGRLTESDTPEQVARGEQRTIVYPSIVRRVQSLLHDQGLYAGDASGQFDKATSDAVVAYQKREKLTVTGIPDQPTLHAMFRRTPPVAADAAPTPPPPATSAPKTTQLPP